MCNFVASIRRELSFRPYCEEDTLNNRASLLRHKCSGSKSQNNVSSNVSTYHVPRTCYLLPPTFLFSLGNWTVTSFLAISVLVTYQLYNDDIRTTREGPFCIKARRNYLNLSYTYLFFSESFPSRRYLFLYKKEKNSGTIYFTFKVERLLFEKRR